MTIGFQIFDGNNLGMRAQSTAKLTVGGREVQAIYNVLRIVRSSIAGLPIFMPIVLWDGLSWRKAAFPDYKASRNAEPETKTALKQKAERDAFKAQRADIIQGLKLLGIRQLISANLEADDFAGILVRRYQPRGKRILLVSSDKDWIQLVGPGVGWFDPVNDRRITLANIEDELGVKTPRAWLEVKALMGDPSDEIPGVGGIGEKGAKELVNTYGSVTNFLNMTIDASLPKLPKKFKDFAEDSEKQDRFARNLMLMDLNSKHVPTPVMPKLIAGNLDRAGFGAFCESFNFQSILTGYDQWIEPFERIGHE